MHKTCKVRMRFVVSKDFLDTGSTPVSSTICGNGVMAAASVLETDTERCAGSNPASRTSKKLDKKSKNTFHTFYNK